MIEYAYRLGGSPGLPVWCCDEAGPFQTVPHPGAAWRPEGEPARQAHESVRNGTAKVLTLFHPASGRVEVEGATSCTNAVRHAWLKRGLAAVLAGPPARAAGHASGVHRAAWVRWQEGLTWPITRPAELPPLRMLLVPDNLAGHRTPDFVLWLFAHGVMPLYTPLGGSWLNMAEKDQADCPSSRGWVSARRTGYHRGDGAAGTGRVVSGPARRRNRRIRMSAPARRPVPPRA